MPTYEYRCPQCGNEFEKFGKMSDPPVAECTRCGAEAQRKISAGAGLVFKGSGFYITDYKKAPQGGDGASSGGGEGKAEPRGEAPASKPESSSSGSSSSGGSGASSGGGSKSE